MFSSLIHQILLTALFEILFFAAAVVDAAAVVVFAAVVAVAFLPHYIGGPPLRHALVVALSKVFWFVPTQRKASFAGQEIVR